MQARARECHASHTMLLTLENLHGIQSKSCDHCTLRILILQHRQGYPWAAEKYKSINAIGDRAAQSAALLNARCPAKCQDD